VDAYNVQQHDYRDGSTKYEASCGNEWPRDIGAFDTPDAAMDACEADYIARCSEFLRVAGPGEVVVKVEDIRAVEHALNEYRTAEENSGKPYPRTPDWMFPLRGLTAAIDAAGGGNASR
jgi:hypothetical protein